MSKKYAVKMSCEVIIELGEVEADSHIEAIEKATEGLNLNAAVSKSAPYEVSTLDDGAIEYLVDEVGDEDYANSCWYELEYAKDMSTGKYTKVYIPL
jgi:hypothetical protein